jgi:hypothetical protein
VQSVARLLVGFSIAQLILKRTQLVIIVRVRRIKCGDIIGDVFAAAAIVVFVQITQFATGLIEVTAQVVIGFRRRLIGRDLADIAVG